MAEKTHPFTRDQLERASNLVQTILTSYGTEMTEDIRMLSQESHTAVEDMLPVGGWEMPSFQELGIEEDKLGELSLELKNDRVQIGGRAVLYLRGEMSTNEISQLNNRAKELEKAHDPFRC